MSNTEETKNTESFADLFNQSLAAQEMRPGEVISAEVVRMDGNFVVVNAGLKSEAYIPIEEFKDDQGEVTVKPGDFVSVASESVETSKGSIIFINKNHRLMYDLKYRIRVICMEDFEHVTNCDEYIGFLYGIISSDHDIETIFIDSILKHADFTLGDLPEFVERLKNISKDYGMDFVVSLSADKEEMIGVDFTGCEILN